MTISVIAILVSTSLTLCVGFVTSSAYNGDALLHVHTRSVPQCEVGAILLHVRPPSKFAHRCNSTQVLTFGCQGQCSSYSEVNRDDPLRLQHTCSCCEPSKFGVHLAEMNCDGGYKLRAPLKFAMRCSCRPCSSASMDIDMLRRMLDAERLSSTRTAKR
nr:bursicon-A2 [Urechis unicinctus]